MNGNGFDELRLVIDWLARMDRIQQTCLVLQASSNLDSDAGYTFPMNLRRFALEAARAVDMAERYQDRLRHKKEEQEDMRRLA